MHVSQKRKITFDVGSPMIFIPFGWTSIVMGLLVDPKEGPIIVP